MSGVFLSYRREDSAGFAGRLADGLEAEFGAGSVFRDVDDIRPGEDFQLAIESQLRSVDAVLVLIGPRWLEARTDGARRLDDPADFVRQEIATALASGKPVIPLLVGGAKMPGEADLPAPLASLARRQAVVLSDSGWQGDVTRLLASLRPIVPALATLPHKSRRLLLGAVVVAAGAALVGWLLVGRRAPLPQPQPAPVTQASVAGRWRATVKYDWGDTYDEVFEFKYLGQTLHGTASFLRVPLTVEQAAVDGEWLRFSTRSHEQLGSDSPRKEVVHRYTGRVTPDSIQFTLESSGGYSIHTPVEFVARRLEAVPGSGGERN
jgi:hypothetical protein